MRRDFNFSHGRKARCKKKEVRKQKTECRRPNAEVIVTPDFCFLYSFSSFGQVFGHEGTDHQKHGQDNDYDAGGPGNDI